MHNPNVYDRAMMIRSLIESGAPGHVIEHEMGSLAQALGGHAPIASMTPEGRMLYLLTLSLTQYAPVIR